MAAGGTKLEAQLAGKEKHEPQQQAKALLWNDFQDLR
jgi:hypothetical protein